jgi:mannose-6-phosphate isomerase
VEIQQLSDVTYRLYDYGRPRELHIDKGLDVADLGVHPGVAAAGRMPLVECPYFVTELVESTAGPGILIAIEGSGRVGGCPVQAGEVWVSAHPVPIEGSLRILRTYFPLQS